MHVNHLPITSLAAHNGSYHYELVLSNEIADTSLVVASGGVNVKFQSGRKMNEKKKEAYKRPHIE